MSLATPALILLALAASPDDQGDGPATFAGDVRPVLERSCSRCHGPEVSKAGIDLSVLADEEASRRFIDLSLQVLDAVELRTMPPPDEPGPTELERQRLVEALGEVLDAVGEPTDPGREPIQRLTHEQYNNSIRDLLGVDLRPADDFPTDGSGGEGFDNNGSTLFIPPILMEKYLAAAGKVLDAAAPEAFLVARPSDDGLSPDEAARRCLERFATRAFRRPATAEEIDRLMLLVRRAIDRGDSFEDAVKLALKAVLVSPSFLFLGERQREAGTEDGAEAEGPYRIDPFEMAARLSYFLWSSIPDDELLELAASGRIFEPEEIDAQVRRMLADPKSRALAEQFAGQWFRLELLKSGAEPSRRRFPEYSSDLRDAMIEEPIAFFHALLREDRSLLDLIDADYTFANHRLAEFYGIPGVSGDEFRRVALEDANRGGVLGMAGILTLTSYPGRTSPVLRGKWVLEELLGTPPPPPPPDVDTLSQDDRPIDGLTFRQRLERHREQRRCASCHAKLDPLGFGLENFDAIGRWRDEIAGVPVDSSGRLTSGEEFTGPAELKRILKESKRDLIVRNLIERMLSYALRRGVEYYDAPTIEAIAVALDEQGDRSQTLISEVAKSYPFQYRRDEPIAAEEEN
ncbi:DUF1592 domain-containing protein [Tautonia sociabilis]|uniref:DUF1592 domain-containing protein n=1 Tax=Tautonia sociabilis TaxID=2080755 RepID=A0A432MLM3_9BACT|nr:DUF1592 domain-containing protein [Tautonia sociabilis]RUL88313.1 DUF1592 domain-containing protein [Tautonia sociabilis]